MSVGVPRFGGMEKLLAHTGRRKAIAFVAIVLISAGVLLSFRVWGFIFTKRYANQSDFFSYLVIGSCVILAMRSWMPSMVKYLSLPRLNLKLMIGVCVALGMYWLNFHSFPHYFPGWRNSVVDILQLLSIGFGEELFSRGFVYGAWRKFGTWQAVIVSSVLFGLMHVGSYFKHHDSYVTFHQVINATAFGVVICGVMLITGSIWTGVVIHAFSDSQLYFDHERVRPIKTVASAVQSVSWDQ